MDRKEMPMLARAMQVLTNHNDQRTCTLLFNLTAFAFWKAAGDLALVLLVKLACTC